MADVIECENLDVITSFYVVFLIKYDVYEFSTRNRSEHRYGHISCLNVSFNAFTTAQKKKNDFVENDFMEKETTKKLFKL